MRNREDPIKRIEALIEKHQGVPGRFENLMNHIADKLEKRVGTYEKFTLCQNEFSAVLLERASKVLLKYPTLSISFSAESRSDFRGGTPASLTIRFKDRQ
jgi:hypothetical protein